MGWLSKSTIAVEEQAARGPGKLLPDSRLGKQLGLLFAIAVVIGGGGVAYGLMNLVVQLCALLILALNREAFFGFWREAPLALRILVAASLAIPVLQLVPLPFDTSASLPGRDHLRTAYALIGSESAFPLSLAPHRTLVAACGLVLPVTMMCLAARLHSSDLKSMLWIAVALGVLNMLIGVPQVASNGSQALFYPENPMPGVLFGSFANRNSTGLFLVAALACLIVPRWKDLSREWRLAQFAIAAMLVLGIVLTRSRSAIVLALIPIGLFGLRFLFAKGRVRTHKLAIATLATCALVATGLIASNNERVGEAFERFDFEGDARSYIWDDAAWSAQKYWPVGSGMGTFDEVFQADESLENLTLRKAGRAHNDYLELAIEAGLPGLLVLAMWLAWIGWRSWIARGSSQRWTAWTGSTILLAIAIQSAIDYPLRNQALLALAALATVVLLRFSREEKP